MGIEKLLEDTSEVYYWIGFLMADGCIHNNARIVIELSIKDELHLKKFCKLIGSNMNYRWIKTNNKFHKYCGTSIYNKKKMPLLCRKFNFVGDKTHHPPNKLYIKNDDLFLSFLIGFIDGDGCIAKRKDRKNDCTLEISCHGSWNKILTYFIQRAWNILSIQLFNSSIKIPKSKRFIRNKNGKRYDTAEIRTRNTDFLWKLKQSALRLKLPILLRKWQHIIKKYSGRKASYDLKNKVIKEFNKGNGITEISKINDINVSSVHEIIHKNKDKWSLKRLKQYKKFGRIPHYSKYGILKA
jgi:hypothetical protein